MTSARAWPGMTLAGEMLDMERPAARCLRTDFEPDTGRREGIFFTDQLEKVGFPGSWLDRA